MREKLQSKGVVRDKPERFKRVNESKAMAGHTPSKYMMIQHIRAVLSQAGIPTTRDDDRGVPVQRFNGYALRVSGAQMMGAGGSNYLADGHHKQFNDMSRPATCQWSQVCPHNY